MTYAPDVAPGRNAGGDPGTAATITADDAPVPEATEGLFAETWAVGSRYALVSELARGGGGKIAVAIDRKLGRKVALKRALDVHGDSRLEREALVLARLEHPAIVPIHDAGYDAEGSPFYTMKLVGGQNLARRIEDAKTFEQRLGLLPALATVADAIAYAHSQHVIHRDLKPQNVLVGEFGEVAVIDWGLGKVLGADEPAPRTTPMPGAQLTVDGAVMGTPAFMAPEQARSADVDERADVYAIGAMLYEVLTGVVPYGDVTSEVTLIRLIEGPPPPVDEREPRVPRELAAIVGKAMARKPADRYPTAKELADDLRRYQAGRLVAAHRYRLHTRAWKWVRRHRASVAIAAGVAATAVASFIAFTAKPVDQTCAGLDAHVVAAWNPTVRGKIEAAFGASGLASAPAILRDVVAVLDRQATAIRTMRTDACHATRITKEQPEAVLSKRMQCLDRRTVELATLTDTLSRADAKAVAQADQTTSAVLGPVEDCADPERLDDLAPLPSDPIVRAEILSVESGLTKLAALGAQDALAMSASDVPALVQRAERTGFGPTIARAHMIQARVLLGAGKTDDAEQLLRASIPLLDRVHDNEDRLRCILDLVRIELEYRDRADIADMLLDLATGTAENSTRQHVLDNVYVYRSHAALERGDKKLAVEYGEKAVAASAKEPGAELFHTRRALGELYIEVARYDDAEKAFHGVIDEVKQHYGTEDMADVAAAYGGLASTAYMRGDVARAIELEQREVAIDDKLRDLNAGNWLAARNNLATFKQTAGQLEEAEREQQAILAECDARLGPHAVLGIDVAFNIATLNENKHEFERAAEFYRDAIRRAEQIEPDGARIVKARARLGGVDTMLGRNEEAVEALQRALDYYERRRKADIPDASGIRADLGVALVGVGRYEGARAELVRALATIGPIADDVDRAYYELPLAKAQWKVGQRTESLATAKEIHQLLAKSPDPDLLAELAAWERSR